MRLQYYLLFALFVSCTNNNSNPKNESSKRKNALSAKVDDPNSDSTDITNPEILNYFKETKTIITDNRPAMKGIKISFDIPKSWIELKINNPNMAYHFFNKKMNLDLQMGVSPPSNDNEDIEKIRYTLHDMFPGFKYDYLLKVAGKDGLQMIHSRTLQIESAISNVNTLTVAFFEKKRLVIFTYGSSSINKIDSIDNIIDFNILYRHFIKTIKVVE